MPHLPKKNEMSQIPESLTPASPQSFAEYENKQVQDHLDLLGIFFYVLSGVGAVFSMFPILHLAFGILFLVNPDFLQEGGNGPEDEEALLFGILMTVMAGGFILLGLIMSFLTFLTGRYMRARRKYTFCLVLSGVICIWVPIGTVLGVFSLINLTKDSAKISFGRMDTLPQ